MRLALALLFPQGSLGFAVAAASRAVAAGSKFDLLAGLPQAGSRTLAPIASSIATRHDMRMETLQAGRPMELWLDCRTGTFPSGHVDSADRLLLSKETKDPMPCPWLAIDASGNKLVSEKGETVGAAMAVDDARGQGRALSLVGSVDWILISCNPNWTFIPAENLVASASGTQTRICFEVTAPSQIQGAAFALELGVDALLLPADGAAIWEAAVECRRQRAARVSPADAGGTAGQGSAAAVRGMAGSTAAPAAAAAVGTLAVGSSDDAATVHLEWATVTGVIDGGVGDRVCLDLIQVLSEGEGVLVGSSSKLLCLVHGETFVTDFVPARPFRVNAGPVHSYCLMADGSTKYLCEVVAGDKVLVVSSAGKSRPVTVGRCKIERRPMVMVPFTTAAAETPAASAAATTASVALASPAAKARVAATTVFTGQVFLQQAETVRLISPDAADTRGWRPLAVTEAAPGDLLLLRVTAQGTHVGRAIGAAVTEL